MTKKLFRVFLLQGILTCSLLFSNNHVLAAQSDQQNWDDVLSNYMNETISDSELINSRFVTHAVRVLDPTNGETETINDKMNFAVYTFERRDSTEPKYDTFIDYYFKEPMKVKSSDRLEVKVTNFLRPITPIKSMMLTKSNQNEEWKLLKEPTPVMDSLQSFTLEGDELANSDRYSRIIIHFSSHSNPDVAESGFPEYELRYTNDPSIYFHFSGIQLITIVAAGVFLLYIIYKQRYKRET